MFWKIAVSVTIVMIVIMPDLGVAVAWPCPSGLFSQVLSCYWCECLQATIGCGKVYSLCDGEMDPYNWSTCSQQDSLSDIFADVKEEMGCSD